MAALPSVTSNPTPPASEPEPRVVPAPYLLTTDIFTRDEAVLWPPHSHEEHELMWVERGIATALVRGRLWTLFPGMGLWIPRLVAHDARTAAGVTFCATLFAPEAWTRAWGDVAAVRVNGAVRQLLVHLARTAMPDEERLRAQQVCIDMLAPLDDRAASVPMPQDPRVRALVDGVLSDPADDRSLEQWAAWLNLSPRTVTRVFSAEVSMSFAQWRRLARMNLARGLLADGMTVAQVGREVGYSTASAFVAAFRKVVGVTPGEMTAGSQSATAPSPERDITRPPLDIDHI